ncbi:MAG TPA: alkaline phosphatase family protein [Thermomicrobiaceae bacterium]|nr:alkaline phosphatase family protein [Thermomicrobiaceae bacterium]
MLIGARADAAGRRVILISIDGMASGYLTRADALGLKIPNLRQLQREGTTAEAVRSVMPSVTFPAHITMITGVNPSRHGVVSNDVLDRRDPGQLQGAGAYVFYEDITARTLFDAVRAQGGTSGAVWWPVTVGAPVDFNFPDYEAPTLKDARVLLRFSSPEARRLVPSPEALIGIGGDTELDALRARIAVAFLEHRPELLAVHFIALDTAAHDHAPYSPEALAALEAVDRHIGTLVAAAKAAGLWDETTLIVTSDHGFVPVERQVRIGTLFADLGLLTVQDDDKLATWAAFPWSDGGAVAIYLNPQAPPATAAKVDKVLELLTSYPEYGIYKVYRGQELASLEGYPGAYAVLDTQAGFTFSGRLFGPVVSPTPLRGVHGQSPDRPELFACLVIRGPGIRQGARIPAVRLLDIAPTVARILHLDLGQVEGRVLTEIFTPPGGTR